jgi:hypothetical protein
MGKIEEKHFEEDAIVDSEVNIIISPSSSGIGALALPEVICRVRIIGEVGGKEKADSLSKTV